MNWYLAGSLVLVLATVVTILLLGVEIGRGLTRRDLIPDPPMISEPVIRGPFEPTRLIRLPELNHLALLDDALGIMERQRMTAEAVAEVEALWAEIEATWPTTDGREVEGSA